MTAGLFRLAPLAISAIIDRHYRISLMPQRHITTRSGRQRVVGNGV